MIRVVSTLNFRNKSQFVTEKIWSVKLNHFSWTLIHCQAFLEKLRISAFLRMLFLFIGARRHIALKSLDCAMLKLFLGGGRDNLAVFWSNILIYNANAIFVLIITSSNVVFYGLKNSERWKVWPKLDVLTIDVIIFLMVLGNK